MPKTTYAIRDIDPAVWARFRARAAREGKAARTVFVQFIETYAAARYYVRASAMADPHYLAIEPGALTTNPKMRLFPSVATALAAIDGARRIFGRDEDLVVTEAE